MFITTETIGLAGEYAVVAEHAADPVPERLD